MEIIIKGDAKEIAGLLVEIAERRMCEPNAANAKKASEHIGWIFQKYFSPSSASQG